MPPFNAKIGSHEGKSFGAYYAKAPSSSASTLILIQEIFGVNAGMRKMVDDWARQGYHAICPDLFWRQQEGVELTDQSEAEWAKAMEFFTGFDVELGIRDLISTMRFARSQENSNKKAGTMGFCLGGKLAFLMAEETDADCNVSFYGVGLDEHLEEVPNIKKPLLMHIAENDSYMPEEKQDRVRAAVRKNKMVNCYLYPGVEHAFAREGGKHYDYGSARLALSRSKDFMALHLR